MLDAEKQSPLSNAVAPQLVGHDRSRAHIANPSAKEPLRCVGIAPSEVMTSGTLCFTTICRSWSSRALDLCTIRLMAKGAAGRPGWRKSCVARGAFKILGHR